ncbi:apolipoprotein N-acyltransferase [Geminocystis sp. NIES-3708]|nr:apolipoprotein N-acyltransferase [Geminocystis sp. NIES-3708]
MGFTVAPTNLWFLGWIALIPLWIALYQSTVTAVLAGLLWGFGYHGFALFWITGIHPMTWMGVSWFNSLIIAIFCWLFITFWGAILVTIWSYILNLIIRKNISKNKLLSPNLTTIFLGVIFWCLLEKIWSFTPLWWTSLSFTQSPYNLAILQLLKISGPTTVTALIVLINGLFAEDILFIKNNYKNSYKNKYSLITNGIILLTITHGMGYLHYQKPLNDQSENLIRIGIIQGNIPNEIKLYDSGFKTAMINYTKGYNYLAEKKVDLIITPETALPFFYNEIVDHSPIFKAINQEKIPLLLGAFDLKNESYTNTLFSINQQGKVISQYDKIKLVPLGEYIPLRKIFGNIINRLSPLDTHLIAGKKDQIFQTSFGQAIVGICYDSAFSDIFRHQALKGGKFIVTASNNAHYSDIMPFQHHSQDVMRSIEADRWTARATNTGYSAIIDPHGNTKWISNLNQFQTHVGEIYRRDRINLYIAKGDWLIILMIVIMNCYIFIVTFDK